MANPFPLCILVRPGFEKTYQSWMLQAPDENVAFGTDVFIVATFDGNRVQAVFDPCTKWAICAWVQFTQGHECNCNSSERPALGPSPRKGSSISPSLCSARYCLRKWVGTTFTPRQSGGRGLSSSSLG